MLFEFDHNAKTFNEEVYKKRQCTVCPLKHNHPPPIPQKQCDILIIGDKSFSRIDSGDTGYSTHYADIVECVSVTQEPDKLTSLCCLGRKASMVTQLKPKIVFAMGYEIYRELETLFGYTPPKVKLSNCPLPTQYLGHEFWLVPMSDFAGPGTFVEQRLLVNRLIQTPPVVHRPNYDNILFVMNNNEIDAAFADLRNMGDELSHDLETTGIEPYMVNAGILSLAAGTYNDRVYAFPILHPQTPRGFDYTKVLCEFWELTKTHTVFAHNLKFELTWLSYFLSQSLLYESKWGDTMAQAHVIGMDLPKSLDFNIRRRLGFNLKKLSDIDVTNLINEPLDKVLQYNALDVKYTDLLRLIQTPLITEEEQDTTYENQIEATRASVEMELKGLKPNHEFIGEQSPIWKDKLAKHLAEFDEVNEVKVCRERFGKCDPLSNKDIKKLFEFFIGCPKGQKKFDEEFLSTVKHPVGEILLNVREANKLFSTYISPLNINGVEENAGKYIQPDGRVHTHFNINLTKTGRLSSDSPNLQNFTSRDGKKYLRNVLMADEGCLFVAIDYAQIEFRVVSALTRDKQMIDSLHTGMDVHMKWALELLKKFDNRFVVDITVKDCKKEKGIKCVGKDKEDRYCCIKAFRGDVKTLFTFPLIYGASQGKIARVLGVSREQTKLKQVLDQFWSTHEGLKRWQERTCQYYAEHGYLENAFGRRYRMELTHNAKLNYPVQGTASDIVVRAMCRLARRAYFENKPWLCPNLNIHDDLTTIVPEEHINEFLPIVVQEMLDVRTYDWLEGVPLGIEVSTGKTWGDLTAVGEFFSNQI